MSAMSYAYNEPFERTEGHRRIVIHFKHSVRVAGRDPEITVRVDGDDRYTCSSARTCRRSGAGWYSYDLNVTPELSAWLDAQLAGPAEAAA